MNVIFELHDFCALLKIAYPYLFLFTTFYITWVKMYDLNVKSLKLFLLPANHTNLFSQKYLVSHVYTDIKGK